MLFSWVFKNMYLAVYLSDELLIYLTVCMIVYLSVSVYLSYLSVNGFAP